MKKHIISVLLLSSLMFTDVSVADTFVVRKIDVEGLQRISPDTVYSYLPIKTGQTLRSDKTSSVINSLYRTGFFEQISLTRRGDTLVIHVVERPTIGQLKISGNSAIATDKLTAVMKSVDVAEGRVYNKVVLEKIKQSLINQYYQLGRYNATVDVSVSKMPRNRVLINVDISEGLIAKVRRINIIGNHAFSEKTLDKQLELSTPGVFTFFTQKDRYSQEKLDASIEKLRNYYMDRGYVRFAVKSSQVAVTPDRKSIFLTIVIEEGEIYTIRDVTISGKTILPHSELMKSVSLHSGDVFSRQAVVDSEKAMSEALGDKGYIFAAIDLRPRIDDKTKQVSIDFQVKPGKRAYVRHIYFTDNTRTNDEVLRREMTQMESSVVSTSRLEESKTHLSRLPYIRDVQMSVQPAEPADESVDVNYKIVENSAAQASVSLGYSQVQKFIFSAGINQKNFLGTGQTVGLNLSRSAAETYYGLSFIDPYYTADGISRSINLSATKYNPSKANNSRSYTNDQYDASVVYGIPIGQEKDVSNRIQLGFGYEETLVHLTNSPSQQVIDFVNANGRHFQQLNLIGGLSRDSRDKAIFPTIGMINTIGANVYLPAASSSLKYYTVNYMGKWYHPVTGKFIATARGDVGYGSSFNGTTNYPFFKNFYAGGMETVRGYTGNTLGPRDSGDYPLGGNFLADASVGLIFPNGISENLRTQVFVDGGNVYNTYNNKKYAGRGSGPVRFSSGIEADWLTMMGPIIVSYARPINPQPGDDPDYFQFSLGANFG